MERGDIERQRELVSAISGALDLTEPRIVQWDIHDRPGKLVRHNAALREND